MNIICMFQYDNDGEILDAIRVLKDSPLMHLLKDQNYQVCSEDEWKTFIAKKN